MPLRRDSTAWSPGRSSQSSASTIGQSTIEYGWAGCIRCIAVSMRSPRLACSGKHGRWMAAVLACAPGAVLSHHAAAGLWGIRRGTRIELTVPPRAGRPSLGSKLHYANLPADETTTHDRIPTTTVPRTLLDLSAVVQRHELRSALSGRPSSSA